MPALTKALDATEGQELIPTELIGTFVASFEYTAPAGLLVAWASPGKGSIVKRFPRWNQLDKGSGVPAGTKTETDTFTDVDLDTTESSIVPGLVGFRLPISDEFVAQVQDGIAVPAAALIECINAENDRIDSDVLGSITSSTNTTGAATDNATPAKFRSGSAVYRALKIPASASQMGHAFIGHFDAFRDLEEGTGSSAAPFTAMQGDESLYGAPGDGAFRGRYMGYLMFESGNVPAESGGWANCFTPIGPRASGLGIVETEMPNIRPTRGDDAENRALTYFNVRAWYGTGITNPSRILEVRSRT